MADRAAFIVINGPGHDQTRLALREGITSFGRLPSNDVILLGDLVSRNHARIIFFDGKASIQDLGSHNGCWVNEEKVSTRALAPGDVVRIGNFKVTFLRGTAGDAISSFVDEDTGTGSGAGPSPPMSAPIPAVQTETHRPRAKTIARQEPRRAEPEGPPSGDLAQRDPSHGRVVKDISAESPAPATMLLLYRVSEALAKARDVPHFLEQVLAFVLERLPSESAAVFRVGDGGEPVRVAVAGPATRTGDPIASMSAVRWTVAKRFSVYSKDIAADLRFRSGKSVSEIPADMRALVSAPVTIEDRVLGALYLSRSIAQPYAEEDVDLVEAIAHLVAAGIERLDTRQRAIDDSVMRVLLARTHSSDVVERLLREDRPFLEARVGTVCFLGIQGFVATAERLPPEEVSEFLTAYLDAMSARIFSQKGVVHSLLGDELVAVFGTPYAYGDDAARAVETALELRTDFDRLISRRPNLGPLRLSVGVDTGRLLAGPVGPSRRMDYTVLGEAVRIAARLRALAPPGTVLVSASTRPALGPQFGLRIAGTKQLRPRQEPEEVFEVVGKAPDGSRTELIG